MKLKFETIMIPVPDSQKIAMQARRIRLSKNLSLRKVARDMNISPSYLSDLELGRRMWSHMLVRKFNDAVFGKKYLRIELKLQKLENLISGYANAR